MPCHECAYSYFLWFAFLVQWVISKKWWLHRIQSMFKDNSGKSQETSPLDETRGDQIYVCVFLMTLWTSKKLDSMTFLCMGWFLSEPWIHIPCVVAVLLKLLRKSAGIPALYLPSFGDCSDASACRIFSCGDRWQIPFLKDLCDHLQLSYRRRWYLRNNLDS